MYYKNKYTLVQIGGNKPPICTSLETAFDVRCFIIPPEDLDNWDRLALKVIALTQAELAKAPRKLPVYLCSESFGGCVAFKVLLQALLNR